MDTNSPRWMSRSTPRNACTSSSPTRYILCRPRIEIIGGSLISECFDRVLSSGLESRIKRAENCARQRDARGNRPPLGNDRLDQGARRESVDREPRDIGEQNPDHGTRNSQQHSLTEKNVENIARGGAQCLQNTNLASSFEYRRVHRKKDHQKADQNAETD